MADIRSLLDSAATYDPNYVYGALLPMRKNKKTKDVELALPGIFKDMAQAVTSPMRALEGKIDPMSPEAVTEAANIAGLLGGSSVAATGTRRMPRGQVNHTVWHGSPHKFDKFDMSKIGTGEGAQAYGHGLYFAESPEVARSYTNAGANSPEITYMGKTYKASTPEGALLRDVNQLGRKRAYEKYPEQVDFIKSINPDDVKFSGGNTYKIDIPDEILPRMLDWDKPLSQQAPEVQAAIQKLNPTATQEQIALAEAKKQAAYDAYMSRPASMDADAERALETAYSQAYRAWQDAKGLNSAQGSLIYHGLAGKGKDASRLLQEAGITGIRYLDGNSRGVGGTSNFVLFDDRLPRIIERNGVPTGLKPWKDDPEALRGLLGM